jgi:hypothetical protein
MKIPGMPISRVAAVVIFFLAFEWWATHNDKERLQTILHRVCEAARQENWFLVGNDRQDTNLNLAQASKIAEPLRPIFEAGCGSPIPTE